MGSVSADSINQGSKIFLENSRISLVVQWIENLSASAREHGFDLWSGNSRASEQLNR